MGSGDTARVADSWLLKPHSFKPVLRNEAPNLKVCELMMADRQGWILEEIATMMEPGDLELI